MKFALQPSFKTCSCHCSTSNFFSNRSRVSLQLRLNFVLVYELLDEILDFGVPQGTSTELLKAFIFCEPQEVDASNVLEQGLSALAKFSLGESKVKSANAAHKSVASRSSRNELFVDVLEVGLLPTWPLCFCYVRCTQLKYQF